MSKAIAIVTLVVIATYSYVGSLAVKSGNEVIQEHTKTINRTEAVDSTYQD